MSVVGSNVLAGAAGQATGYDIPYSIKTAGTGERISRTMNSTGAATPYFTYSTWYKKSQPVTLAHLLWWQCTAIHSNAVVALSFPADSRLRCNLWTGSASEANRYSTEKYRDPSAWMHFVWQWNGATLAMYMNGVLINMDTSGNINGNSWGLQTGNIMRVSSADHGDGDGYTAETYFIEGQTLAASNFGELNEVTGQWIPKEYEGTFTGNSFYLDYADSSDLGKDVSGLGNDFTVSGGIDANSQMLDTPTNNYCTLNPLGSWVLGASYGPPSMSEGNLKATSTGASYFDDTAATISPTSGKWYYEICLNQLNLDGSTGYVQFNIGGGAYIWSYYNTPTTKIVADATTTVSNFSVGDILQFAVDIDNGKAWFGNNGTWYTTSGTPDPAAGTGQAYTFTYSGDLWDGRMTRVQIRDGSGTQIVTCNFGQDSSFAGNKTAQGNGGTGEDFYYTPPAGFVALNTDNLSDPSIALPTDHFETVLYTGATAPNNVTGVGFSPDLFWNKSRTGTYQHMLYDTVRGATKYLVSNDTDAEATDVNSLTSFDSDGVTLGSSGSSNAIGVPYVGWNWKAGGTAVSNTDGTITSSVSANPTAGFSIVGYTGTGSTATVGHGLSQKPNLAIVKKRESNGADGARSWIVSGDEVSNWTYLLALNQTAASWANAAISSPTSSTLTLSTEQAANYSGDTYIMYCFHSVEGYSKVGKFTGANSTDANFIYCGFKPALVLLKNYGAAEQWCLYDDQRNPYNVVNDRLRPDSSAAEAVHGALDFVSNGFKIRSADISAPQGYIFYAVASSPFKTSNAR